MNTAPYGSWKSPITPAMITASSIDLSNLRIDVNGSLYWLELRSQEGGRCVIVRLSTDGLIEDVTQKPFNVRTRVHEYGGAPYTVYRGIIYFSNFEDGRVYQQVGNSAPTVLTETDNLRFADMVIDSRRNRIICVCEDHSSEKAKEPENYIATISLQDGAVKRLASGADFYSSPRLSPNGEQLAFITWNHPNMPWDNTLLLMLDLSSDGEISNIQLVSRSDSESIVEPHWSPDNALHFISDRNDWWNIYTQDNNPVIQMNAEFATPNWVFGMSHYDFISDGKIVATYTEEGTWKLGLIDLKTGCLEKISQPHSSISQVRVFGNKVYFLGGSPTESTSVVCLNLETRNIEVIKKSNSIAVDKGYVSTPQPIEFSTEDNLSAYGIFYPPKNKDFVAPRNELPPCLVMIHGGPTAATGTTLDLSIQYWTSRGIAVLDVNYGGSTGYGREYRERLYGKWGVVDVDDCVNGALHLAKEKLVDGNKLIICGASAGGYTTLAALTFHDVFKAGASHFGVSDIEALAADTHKFESRYLDKLVGPYPEFAHVYRERSPIHSTDKLSCPVIFFQGLDDKVVPPNQAESMVNALRAKGLPVAYVTFEGEQHGFRKEASIKRALDAELYFYSRVFGFNLADPIAEPLVIENLD